VVQRGGRSHTYTPEKTQRAEARLAQFFMRSQPRWRVDGASSFVVTMGFHCATRHRRDIDNLVKTVLDGFNGVVWKDDAQVMEIAARKFLGVSPARTEIVIGRVDD
jgi:Holliday junction resolvase RusA-like endonuclease